MDVLTGVVTGVVAALMVGVAVRKLGHRPAVVRSYERVGVPERRLDLLAGILVAGAAGLAVGLVWPPLGVVAGACTVAYFVLAVAAHVRYRDLVHVGPPVVLLVLAAAALWLRVSTW